MKALFFAATAFILLMICCKPTSKTTSPVSSNPPTAAVPSNPFPAPVQADADRGKTTWSECSLENLTQAHTLYMNKCGTCHNLKALSSQDEAGWKNIVPPMAKKAKLTAEEQELVLHYVLTMRNSGQ